MDFYLIAGGLAGLVFGGELLVRNAVHTATRLRIPPFVIGASVVGFGTSLPELVVAVRAALGDHAGLVLGNVIGSNIANVLLALGATAAIVPIAFPNSRAMREDSVIGLVVTLLFAALVLWVSELSRLAGTGFLVLLVAVTVRMIRKGEVPTGEVPEPEQARSLVLSTPLIILGLAIVAAGAEALVRGGSGLAHTLGISEAVIGLSVIAIGTSLPEVAVGVVAAFRGQAGLAIGGVLGSNLFNMLGITGAAALARPVELQGVVSVSSLVMFVACAALLTWLVLTRTNLGRLAGVALLLCQGGWIVLLYLPAT